MRKAYDRFQTIITRLLGTENGDPLCGINPAHQFRPGDDDEYSIARNLNAAFLIALAGPPSPDYAEAVSFLNSLRGHPAWGEVAAFYSEGSYHIEDEILNRCGHDRIFSEDLDDLVIRLSAAGDPDIREILHKVHHLFFPEGQSPLSEKEREVARLRKRRKVGLTALNPHPIADPAGEILFTSNVMITVPLPGTQTGDLPLASDMIEAVDRAAGEEQLYWYDHPIPVGIEPDRNEAIYGMRGLQEAIRFEITRGNMVESDRVKCLLSVSTTHAGLREVAKKYMEGEFSKAGGMDHLDIYMFTEADTQKLADEVLVPAMEYFLEQDDLSAFREVFGVDGKYGRHYSFLKALPALWQIFVDPRIRGTFKIDLDQVFPQDVLVEKTGRSVFEHLMTPLWGALGEDQEGDSVELGMLAGALVNEGDIEKGLFTPDVPYPTITITDTNTITDIAPDQWVFFSQRPQALSTEAEMMTRYDEDSQNNESECVQRIHVTGGTTGILVDSLRKYRPITPTFIGRAEDQAYLMSVIFANEGKCLRYVHGSGLFMRHDKNAFARDAIEAAQVGKIAGDLARILLFTAYARSLPWDFDRIKDLLDPFTGCFISRIPVTVVYLSLALKAASLFGTGSEEDAQQGMELIGMCSRNLTEMIGRTVSDRYPLSAEYSREKEGWDLYYDVLDGIEKALKEDDPFALELKARAGKIIGECRLDLGKESEARNQ
jgi:hypothetical protein